MEEGKELDARKWGKEQEECPTEQSAEGEGVGGGGDPWLVCGFSTLLPFLTLKIDSTILTPLQRMMLLRNQKAQSKILMHICLMPLWQTTLTMMLKKKMKTAMASQSIQRNGMQL